mmetsp:Transcript_67085/g.169380  ORF Transcript_67085/g.169380 Transcript_67085/m.169380 type:complete len:206 (-) Transcript_67085:294-911(-)
MRFDGEHAKKLSTRPKRPMRRMFSLSMYSSTCRSNLVNWQKFMVAKDSSSGVNSCLSRKNMHITACACSEDMYTLKNLSDIRRSLGPSWPLPLSCLSKMVLAYVMNNKSDSDALYLSAVVDRRVTCQDWDVFFETTAPTSSLACVFLCAYILQLSELHLLRSSKLTVFSFFTLGSHGSSCLDGNLLLGTLSRASPLVVGTWVLVG